MSKNKAVFILPGILLGICFFAAGSTVFFACSSSSKTKLPDKVESAGANVSVAEVVKPKMLSREMAAIRTRQLGRITYNLWLGFDREQPGFQGRMVINFELKSKARDYPKKVFLDFNAGTLLSMNLNGVRIPSEEFINHSRYDGQKIYFHWNELQVGMNRVEISYQQEYSPDGFGLRRVIDLEDSTGAGTEYLFTRFKPFGANQVFPCFDQPDLKASFELTVEAPSAWTVVANMPERETSVLSGRKSWVFALSPLMSTYLFSLYAGPFRVWDGDAEGIPIRLLARKSQAVRVDHRQWLDLTKKGLESFSVRYGYPYPYGKYDQVILPQLQTGPQEGLATVAFTEKQSFFSSDQFSEIRLRDLMILHGLSHMWFGSLVTVRWWSGMWVNESIALLTSLKAYEEIFQSQGRLVEFYQKYKQMAYREEEAGSTPVENPIKDVEQLFAESSKDDWGVYARGTSIFRQLEHYIGEEDFSEGLQRLVQKFALRNIVVGDVLRQMGEASGKDLVNWDKQWFQTSGLNQVRAEWSCEVDPPPSDEGVSQKRKRKPPISRITAFRLIQSLTNPLNLPDSGVSGEFANLREAKKNPLRIHRMTIGLYYLNKVEIDSRNPPTDFELIPVTYSGTETYPLALRRKPCPDFVVLNEGDLDYVRTEADSKSFEMSQTYAVRIDDPLTRVNQWGDRWKLALDKKISLESYYQAVLGSLREERHPKVLDFKLSTLVSERAGDLTVLWLASEAQKKEWREKIDSTLRTLLLSAPPGSERQQILFKHWAGQLMTSESIRLAKQWCETRLKRQAGPRGMLLSSNQIVQMLRALARLNDPQTEALLQKWLGDQPTAEWKSLAATVNVSFPTEDRKKKWAEYFLFPNPQGLASPEIPIEVISRSELLGAMQFFHGFDGKSDFFAEKYFDYLTRSAKKENGMEYNVQFAESLFPVRCDASTIQKTEEIQKKLSDESQELGHVALSRILRIKASELQQCIKHHSK